MTARIDGPGAAALAPFLRRYLAWLRRHGGLDIALGRAGANLHLRLVPGAAFAARLPGAACALVAGDRAWPPRPAAPPGPAEGGALTAMTIFLPADAAPHRLRACLIEEIAQALGPVNDIPGLGDTIFNDDDAHLWPTRLDLLMLRVLYDPALESGLARAEAERRARRVLGRINPAGRRARALPPLSMPGEGRWRRLMATATARGTPPGRRRSAARDALAIARGAAPGSAFACQSAALLARLTAVQRPARALGLLRAALSACAAAHGAGDIRLDRLQIVAARALLAAGRPAAALEALDGRAARLAGYGLDADLASLYALSARAAARLGRGDAERLARRARAWGAHAFGADRTAPLDWY